MAKVFSNEDANLANSSRVVRERGYSDIDLTLNANIISESDKGDIYKKLDAASVKQSLKNLILTNRFEKPYRPAFGANLGSKLFELIDETSGNEVIDSIKKSIERYEPRAKILNIKVFANPNSNSLSVTLEFRIINTSVSESFNVNLKEPFTLDRVLVQTPTPEPLGVLLGKVDESRVLISRANSSEEPLEQIVETYGKIMTSGGRFIAFDDGLRSDISKVLVRENNDDIITTETGLPINI